MSRAATSVSLAVVLDCVYVPSAADQVPRPASGRHPSALPSAKSSRNSTDPSGAVTCTSSYFAAVDHVDRPIAPVMGCGCRTLPVAFVGTTRSPTLFMNSFWTS